MRHLPLVLLKTILMGALGFFLTIAIGAIGFVLFAVVYDAAAHASEFAVSTCQATVEAGSIAEALTLSASKQADPAERERRLAAAEWWRKLALWAEAQARKGDCPGGLTDAILSK